MDRLFSFFRVFDIAFFAPGTVLFAAWHYGSSMFERLPCVKEVSTPFPSSSRGLSSEGILYLIVCLGIIYSLGLVVHALRELLSSRRRAGRGNPSEVEPKGSWYTRLQQHAPYNEMILYFWYLRATCWNLMLALPLAALVAPLAYIFDASSRSADLATNPITAVYATLLFALAVVFAYGLKRLGDLYDDALDKATRHDPTQTQTATSNQ